jgi:hypothetical protein
VEPIARRGIVFIAWTDNEDEPGFYSGYWDGAEHGRDEGFLGQMPATPSTDEALEWARARSDRVKIRPSWDPAHYYSAGSRAVRGLPRLEWIEGDK